MFSFKNTKRGLTAHGVRYLLILLVLMTLLAPTAYAQTPPPVAEAVAAGTPATVPPAVTISGTTAVLPVTGQSILWVVLIGAVLLCGGIFLFLRTRKANQGL